MTGKINLKKISIFAVFIWLCFLAVDGLIACGIAEIWIRAFIPVQNVCYNHDNVLGDTRCPNQKTYGYVEKGYSNILTTNSAGFHDVERTKEKTKGTLRIQYFGDSFTSGVGVPVKKTIPSLVEEDLKAIDPTLNVEVMNMAPAEDSTVAQFLTYMHVGQKYSSEIVICHFMGDFHDNIPETHQRTRSPYFKLDNNNLQFIPPTPVNTNSPVERLKRSSLLVRLLANKLLASKFYNNVISLKETLLTYIIKDNTSTNPTEEKNKQNTIPHQQKVINLLTYKSWPLTLRVIQEFKKKVENNGNRFILIDGRQFTTSTAGEHKNEDLGLFCNNNNITYVPVYDEYLALKKASPSKKYFLRDGHPTSTGNSVLSRIIASKLKNEIILVNK